MDGGVQSVVTFSLTLLRLESSADSWDTLTLKVSICSTVFTSGCLGGYIYIFFFFFFFANGQVLYMLLISVFLGQGMFS